MMQPPQTSCGQSPPDFPLTPPGTAADLDEIVELFDPDHRLTDVDRVRLRNTIQDIATQLLDGLRRERSSPKLRVALDRLGEIAKAADRLAASLADLDDDSRSLVSAIFQAAREGERLNGQVFQPETVGRGLLLVEDPGPLHALNLVARGAAEVIEARVGVNRAGRGTLRHKVASSALSRMVVWIGLKLHWMEHAPDPKPRGAKAREGSQWHLIGCSIFEFATGQDARSDDILQRMKIAVPAVRRCFKPLPDFNPIMTINDGHMTIEGINIDQVMEAITKRANEALDQHRPHSRQNRRIFDRLQP